MRAHMPSIIAVLTLAGAGCLTTPASESGWTKRARDARPKACGESAIIEDMEDGDSRILVREGRGGYWFSSIDNEGSVMQPSGQFKMGAPGHAGSKHAAHMTGTMAPAGWSVYALMSFGIAEPKGPYDARRYSGVSFWGKGPGHIRFMVADAYTSPGGGFCSDCYNHFGIELALTADWQRYTIPFEWLSMQSGWGDPRAEVAKEGLFEIQWQFGSRGKTFDVWIDDVEFVCGVEGAP